jgi:hypothetical protein
MYTSVLDIRQPLALNQKKQPRIAEMGLEQGLVVHIGGYRAGLGGAREPSADNAVEIPLIRSEQLSGLAGSRSHCDLTGTGARVTAIATRAMEAARTVGAGIMIKS